jgi:hypothetical protein
MILSFSDDPDNPAILTPLSLIHVISGLVFASFAKYMKFKKTNSFIYLFILHGLYEVKDLTLNKDGYHNSIKNSIGDQICSLIGFFIGWNLDITQTFIISCVLFFIFLSPISSRDRTWPNNIKETWSSMG